MSINITVDGVALPYPSAGESDTAAMQIAFARALAAAIARRPGSMVAFSVATAPANTSTNFLRPFGSTFTADTTEVTFRVPFACTISKLYVQAASGPSGAAITLTVRKNGSNTALTCALAIAGTQAADTSNSVSFAAGDRLSISCVGGVGISGTATQVYATLKLVED